MDRVVADTFLNTLLEPFSELPKEIAKSLSEEGYVVLPDMVDEKILSVLRSAFDEIVEREGRDAAREHHQEAGTHRIANLVNKGRIFEASWCHPLILSCCLHMFGRPFKLSSCNGREALRDGGHQPLHSDWKGKRGSVDSAHSCNALWAIDDLTEENGAPRLVPRSHLMPGPPEAFIDDPKAAHPDEIVAVAPAGSVVMINAHTWHGGTTNRSGDRRRVLHAYYTAREHEQQQDQRKWAKDETRERLSEEQRWLLDID